PSDADRAAFTRAAKLGMPSVVEAYLQYPLDPDAQDLALISVVYEETACLDVLRLLFEATATLECRDDTGATPLLLTSEDGNLEATRLLIEAKADLQALDD
ncbi:ASB3, partial [Symbiodinium pilosum]